MPWKFHSQFVSFVLKLSTTVCYLDCLHFSTFPLFTWSFFPSSSSSNDCLLLFIAYFWGCIQMSRTYLLFKHVLEIPKDCRKQCPLDKTFSHSQVEKDTSIWMWFEFQNNTFSMHILGFSKRHLNEIVDLNSVTCTWPRFQILMKFWTVLNKTT